MPRNFWPIALITGLGLARIPTAIAIAYVALPPPIELPRCNATLDSEPIPQLVERIKHNDDQSLIPGRCALLEHPDQTDPYSRAAAVSALVSIAPGSLPTLQAILDEGIRGEQLEYFNTLESVNPFPPELAPAVVTAIHKLQGQPHMVSVLRTALVHTHTDLPGGARTPEATQDIGDRLADGLLALTQQSRPIVVNDLIQQLHLDPNIYDDQGDVVFRRLSHKRVSDPGSPKTDLIDSIDLSEVRQEFDVILKAGYCVSATAVRSHLPAPPAPKLELPTIIVSADRADLGSGVLRFKSAEKQDRCSLVDLGDQCSGHVRIVKTFKDDARCALIPSRRNWVTD